MSDTIEVTKELRDLMEMVAEIEEMAPTEVIVMMLRDRSHNSSGELYPSPYAMLMSVAADRLEALMLEQEPTAYENTYRNRVDGFEYTVIDRSKPRDSAYLVSSIPLFKRGADEKP